MSLNLRMAGKKIPNRRQACPMCGAIVMHNAVVTVDRDGDGMLTEKDAIWIPKEQHLAPCKRICVTSPTRIPEEKMHGYEGACKDCGKVEYG